jgi:carboxymethylenebutenolidase
VPRIDVQVPTPDGVSPSTLHLPEGGGPWPGVLFLPDAAGAREVMRAMADRLAGFGYAVLLPDTYYRAGDWTPFDVSTVFTVPEERARLGELAGALTADRVAADTGAYLDFLLARPEVTGTTAGTTGYCMGGRQSLQAAGMHPGKVAAAASFHGGNLAAADDPAAPHTAADRITATVYVAGAVEDASFDDEQAQRLEAALTGAGVRHTIETYPAHHGFAVPDNPTYDESAADRHWAALEKLYADALRG